MSLSQPPKECEGELGDICRISTTTQNIRAGLSKPHGEDERNSC